MAEPVFIRGLPAGVIIRALHRYSDERGGLIELLRTDETRHLPVMIYASITMPGIRRGPHEHREQADYFAFVGPGSFRIDLWDNRERSPTWWHKYSWTAGENAQASVFVPPGVVHAYTNVGNVPGLVINMPNRLYAGASRAYPVDEIRHEADPNNPFK